MKFSRLGVGYEVQYLSKPNLLAESEKFSYAYLHSELSDFVPFVGEISIASMLHLYLLNPETWLPPKFPQVQTWPKKV